MKKFLSLVIAVSVICAALPAYAYNKATYHGYANELKTLIEECKALGINTQYEEIDANIIETYADRIEEFEEGGLSSSITQYQLSELTSLYTNAKANLQAYKAGTKTAPEKVYTYETGYDFESDGASLKATNGAPYFSIGFGHFGLNSSIEEFNSYGYDNVQAVIGLGDVISPDRGIDDWDTSTNGDAEVTFEVSDSEGYSNDTSIEVMCESTSAANRYGRLFQKIAVKPNTTYIISFRAKGTADSGAFTYSVDGFSNHMTVSGLNTESWKKITSSFTTGADEYFKDFTMLFKDRCDIYIDDITIHKNGDSRNLIKNGDFDGDEHDDFDIRYQEDNKLNSLLRTLGEAEKHNVHVDVLLQLQQDMPAFILTSHTEAENKAGHKIYNVDTAISEEIEEAYIKDILGLISEYKSLSSITLVNEPHYNTSWFGTAYNTRFANYLQEIHTTSELNNIYGTTSYASVGIPTSFESTARYYDWKNFNDKVFTDWYEKTVAIVKDCIPGIPVSVKAQADFEIKDRTSSSSGDIRGDRLARGANMELIDEFSDFHGNDATASYESNGDFRGIVTKWYDYLNSISNKPIYNSENHITVSGGESSGPTEWSSNINKFVKNDIWQSAIHGLDMSSIWTWSTTTNTESSQYGHLALRPSVISDVAKTNLNLNSVSSKVSLLANATPDVAILRSDASRIYNSRHSHALSVAYDAAMESGHKVGFVTKNNIADKLSSYSTLIIPYATNVEENVINAINGFSGTIIIIGSDSLKKSEYNKAYSGSTLTKVNNIYSKASVQTVTNNGTYEISAPAKSTLAAALKSGRVVTVTNSNGSPTDNVEWQYVSYESGYLVNVANYAGTDKTLNVAINGTKAAHLTSLLDGTDTLGSLSIGGMTSGLYYVSNTDSAVTADNWGEVARKPQLLNTNDITVLNGTRNGNVNTLTWKAQSYGKYNVYEVKSDGSLEFIASTYDEIFEDTSAGVKTYVVKCVTATGESNGKAITLGFNLSSIAIVVDNAEGKSTIDVEYENNNDYAVAVTVIATATNEDESFAGAAIVEQIIPAGETMSYSKGFKTIGTGSITVTKK